MDESKKDSVEGMSIESFQPKKSCKKCHGTGRIGFIEGDINRPYPCRCLVRIRKNVAIKPETSEIKPTVVVEDGTTPKPGQVGVLGPSGHSGV